MLKEKEFLTLYKKFLDGNCTADELKMLENFKDGLRLPNDQWNEYLGDEKSTYEVVMARITHSIKSESKSKASFKLFKVAAILFLFISFTLVIRKYNNIQKDNLQSPRQNESFKISPGTFKAYIKVGDRKAVTLNEINRNQVVMLNKMEISKITNGIISYANIKHKELEVPLINEIGTPKGGEYQIILSDGTKVWLNSASSIKFPSRFVGDARRVVLKGEAYFEVSKNAKMPFYVNTDKTEVKVIGTSFNVRAYDDERIIKTTLLEGSVQLRVHAIKVLLKPGEQGAVSVTNQIAVGDVNVEDEIAWKNGVFAFNDQNIQTIMSDISRWYDVDVVFQNPNMKKKFYGKVSKYKDVKQVLRKLSLTGAVHFKTEGRRITVME